MAPPFVLEFRQSRSLAHSLFPTLSLFKNLKTITLLTNTYRTNWTWDCECPLCASLYEALSKNNLSTKFSPEREIEWHDKLAAPDRSRWSPVTELKQVVADYVTQSQSPKQFWESHSAFGRLKGNSIGKILDEASSEDHVLPGLNIEVFPSWLLAVNMLYWTLQLFMQSSEQLNKYNETLLP